jgi:hypothetical protein
LIPAVVTSGRYAFLFCPRQPVRHTLWLMRVFPRIVPMSVHTSMSFLILAGLAVFVLIAIAVIVVLVISTTKRK